MNLAAILACAGRLGEAENAFRRLLRATKRSTWNEAISRNGLAEVLLAQGKYTEAWPHHESRFCCLRGGDPRPHGGREWKGEDIRGKRLAIMVEQGFGDQIQFARFAPWLQAQGVHVTLACKPELARLFKGLGVAVAPGLLEEDGGVVWDLEADYWVMSMSVPYRAHLTLSNLPSDPYLPTPPAAALPSSARFGVVTWGDQNHTNDHNRSIPADLAAEMMSWPGAFSLKPEHTGAKDFYDTAALIAGLDLVITVDQLLTWPGRWASRCGCCFRTSPLIGGG